MQRSCFKSSPLLPDRSCGVQTGEENSFYEVVSQPVIDAVIGETGGYTGAVGKGR